MNNCDDICLDDSLFFINQFIDWKSMQKVCFRGGKKMYDVHGYYKYLNDIELLDYFRCNVYNKLKWN